MQSDVKLLWPVVLSQGTVSGVVVSCGGGVSSVKLCWQVGDVVLVTAMNINGQWEGEVNGRRGDFPFVYIQFDDETSDADPSLTH